MVICFFFIAGTAQAITIIIDPAGDTTHPGRLIEHSFEAGLTMQCAQAIQQALPGTIMLIRTAGKNQLPLIERQSYANRLAADLYISLSFYADNQPTIALYYYCAHPVTDLWQFPYHPLMLVPFEQIHRRSLRHTVQLADQAAAILHKHSSVLIQPPLGIPIPELQGLICPALKCEIGLTHATQWQSYVPVLTNLLEQLMELL